VSLCVYDFIVQQFFSSRLAILKMSALKTFGPAFCLFYKMRNPKYYTSLMSNVYESGRAFCGVCPAAKTLLISQFRFFRNHQFVENRYPIF